MLNRVCLLLGSNVRPEVHLPAAVRELRSLGELQSISSVWQSAPIGATGQPDYCNLAVLLATTNPTEELLDHSGSLRQIESRLGRIRDPRNKYAARTIDIDLVSDATGERFCGGKVLPDPDLRLRACVAMPVSQLDGLAIPGLSRAELLGLAEQLRATQSLIPRPDIDAAVARELTASPQDAGH